MTYDDIDQSKEDQAQIDIERQREIDAHAKYLADKMGIGEFESMAISCISSRMESVPRRVLCQMFEGDVNFQDWITSVRDEFCRRIADADLKDYYHDRY